MPNLLALALALVLPAAQAALAGAPVQEPAAAASAALVPGALPADASPEARAAWQELLKAAAPAAGGAVRAFDLTFEGSAYSADKQTNDFDARYRYLEPGFVRMTLLPSSRERMRGPRGDFLVEKDRPIRIEGRELKEDLRELDDTLGLARTFVGLTDPRNLRIARLELMAQPPAGLPAQLARRAAELRWLELVSPDFRRARGAQALHRVQLGLRRDTHLPALAVVAREQPGGALELETAQLVELEDFRALDGFRVPFHLRSYGVDAERSPWGFAERQSVDLYLLEQGASLRPPLTPADFVPAGI